MNPNTPRSHHNDPAQTIEQPKIALTHIVQSGDTMLGILQKNPRIESYVADFITANHDVVEFHIKPGDTVAFVDNGSHYTITVNDIPHTRLRDGKVTRFFKSYEQKTAAEAHDKELAQEAKQTQERLEKEKKIQELGNTYGFVVKPATTGRAYVIESNNTTLDMRFSSLQALESAMKVIASIRDIYNKEFTGKKRPAFYVQSSSFGTTIKVDNRIFNDTVYLSSEGFRPFIAR